jgi:hypothetical protein
MPRDKDLKRLVRSRMQKTGESYTTARARILSKPSRKRSDSTGSASPADEGTAPPDVRAGAALHPTTPDTASTPDGHTTDPGQRPDYAKTAGMSDQALVARTGCDWEKWVHVLDRHKAHEMSHRDIARLVHEQYGIDGWWAQCVTVGYERIRGLRERGQRRGGGYEASKSRTFAVPVNVLYDACAHARTRRRWITDSDPEVRTATRPRSIRLGLEDGTIAALWFVSKGEAKSSVTVQHLNLTDRTAADRSKALWGARLDALSEILKKA